MTQQTPEGPQPSEAERRSRGPSKVFPSVPFEEVLLLPRSILEHGIDGRIQRLTLFGRLGRSPTSGPTRRLITNSGKYGLTTGSYAAASLSVTDNGRTALDDQSIPQARARQFQLAIQQFPSFNTLYEKLKEKRLPDAAVLRDELGHAGVPSPDQKTAAEVFTANARFLGLIHDINGADYVRALDEEPGPLPPLASDSNAQSPSNSTPPTPQPTGTSARPVADPAVTVAAIAAATEPSVHIDIQIHIDSNATPDQIDQIFASMARHLYSREG